MCTYILFLKKDKASLVCKAGWRTVVDLVLFFFSFRPYAKPHEIRTRRRDDDDDGRRNDGAVVASMEGRRAPPPPRPPPDDGLPSAWPRSEVAVGSRTCTRSIE